MRGHSFGRSLGAVCIPRVIGSWAFEDIRKIRVLLRPAQDEVAVLGLRVLHMCTARIQASMLAEF